MAKLLDSTGLSVVWSQIKSQFQETLVSGTNIKTINGESILGSGDITVDLGLYIIVSSLPEDNIDTNKIYLVANADGQDNDVYIEYIYANGVWEKLGEYKASVDLADYVKNTDYADDSTGGVIKTGYSESGNNYAVKVDASGNAYVSVPWTDTTYTEATTSQAGLMSAADKTKLDAIDEYEVLTSEEILAICV